MAMPKTALEGIRVLDLGRYQAGPRIGLVLARLGAEVIRVEAPGGNESRRGGPFVRGQSAYWVQYNSGKKSLGLDMRNDKGKEIVHELVKVSDILIQNFRPGTIATMGLGYDQLKALNPRIIMVNISAYGQLIQRRKLYPASLRRILPSVVSGTALYVGSDGALAVSALASALHVARPDGLLLMRRY